MNASLPIRHSRRREERHRQGMRKVSVQRWQGRTGTTLSAAVAAAAVRSARLLPAVCGANDATLSGLDERRNEGERAGQRRQLHTRRAQRTREVGALVAVAECSLKDALGCSQACTAPLDRPPRCAGAVLVCWSTAQCSPLSARVTVGRGRTRQGRTHPSLDGDHATALARLPLLCCARWLHRGDPYAARTKAASQGSTIMSR